MFKLNIKIAFRNFLKNRTTSILNVLGLSIGIACSILITLFVMHELSYDKYHERADRIYRIAVRALIGDTKINQTYSSAITFQKLLEDFPEIETGVKISRNNRIPVKNGGSTFYETGILAVDSTFFDVFTFPLIHGDPNSALGQPNSLVVTEGTALRYFNSTDVLGKNLDVDLSSYGIGNVNFVITGISEDVPSQSHFHFDFLISLMTFPDFINNPGWSANNFISYVVLEEGASMEQFEIKLKDFTRKYMGMEEFDAWEAKGNFWEYFLQPVTEIHLKSDLNGEFEANGNETYIKIFSLISIVIVMIACINFMNLSTAKSSRRAREVGLRKVVGSGRSKILFQFLLESILLSFISLGIGLLLVHLLLPLYSDFVGTPLQLNYAGSYMIVPLLIALGLVVGIISGSFPALYLSSFKPINAIKNKLVEVRGIRGFRDVLVIFQFAISIFLITGTIIVYEQLEYFQNKRLGFVKEQVLIINNPGTLTDNVDAFKEELRNHTSILEVSGTNMLPGQRFSNIGFGAEGIENFTLNIGICDYDFDNTLKLEMANGRFFSRDFESDSSAAIINEKAAELLGWADPLGKEINNWSSKRGEFTVIGVVKDFHYESLHQEIRPMALFLSGGYYKRVQSSIAVRIDSEKIDETISHVEKVWNKLTTKTPFEYSFLDENFDNLYSNEKQTQRISTVFSILAIFIACLGLFGLASYVAEQRTKEIGIRKALGASVNQVVRMLNSGFVKWVLVASVFAFPATWLVMGGWLQNFAYRISMSWWMFLIAAILAIMVALFVVSIETIKAAIKNPVDSLKYE